MLALFTAVLLTAPQPAHAQVVFSNLPASGYISGYSTNFFDVGVIFTVPTGDNYTLNSITTQLSGPGATYQADLYNSTTSTVSAHIAQIGGTFSVSSNGAHQFTAGSPITLQAGQSYAIVFSGSGGIIGLTSSLPSGTFTFESGLIYDKAGASWSTKSHESPAVEIDASPQVTPTASFTYVATDLSVDFTDTSTDAPTGWSWTFGDSGISTTQDPTHVYASDGTYSVCLTASNSYGSSGLSCQNITVLPAPAPSATAVTNTPISSLCQDVTVLSNGAITASGGVQNVVQNGA